MAIYEYECSRCKKIFEEMMSMADCKSVLNCPKCGKPANKIISSSVSVFVKGGTPKFHKSHTNRRKTEERWMEKECEVTKRHIKGQTGGKSPYSTMFLNPDYFKKKYGSQERSKEDIKKIEESNKKVTAPIRKNLKNIDKIQ